MHPRLSIHRVLILSNIVYETYNNSGISSPTFSMVYVPTIGKSFTFLGNVSFFTGLRKISL